MLGVTVIPLDAESVQVTWVQLSSQDIAGYRVYFTRTEDSSSIERRQEAGRDSVVDLPAQANSTRVEGLVRGAQYLFQVVGVVIVNGLKHDGERSNGSTLIAAEVRGESPVIGQNLSGNCPPSPLRKQWRFVTICHSWYRHRSSGPHSPIAPHLLCPPNVVRETSIARQ